MLKVIGAGFGRTGTHSLGMALEKLGFGPCYNIYEFAKNPDHADLWNKAMDGKAVDWTYIFDSYQSAVEWPGVAFLDELIGHFPHSRVILTLRDPKSWYESASRTIFEGLELSTYNPDPLKRERSDILRRLILERTFGGQHWNKEHSMDVYRKHIQHVLRTVPQERLFQFDVKNGWKPLCDFLQKPVPKEAFPRLNERGDFLDSQPMWAEVIKEAKSQKSTRP